MTADTLAALLLARAGDDRPGLLFEDRVWSWREHVADCRNAAARLAAITDPSWRAARAAGRPHVGVLCDNVPGLPVLVGAAALGGCVVVALNPTRSPAELARDAAATDVALLLYDGPYEETATALARDLRMPRAPLATLTELADGTHEAGSAENAECGAGDLMMLIFTSGTSGRPRAVRITQRKLAVPGRSLGALLTPDDVVYCPMPLFHSGALMAAYAPAVASGAALVLRRRFSASGLLPDVRRYGCTYLHYVGKALSYVLATPPRPDDADNPLRLAFGNEGSATATRRFGERFGCRVIDAFGSTETAISLTPDPAAPPGALGRLPDGVEIRDPFTGERCAAARFEDGRLLNPGEAIGELVNVSGGGLFDGYYNDPEADAERLRDGAFWSGDLAYADARGHVFFAGRGTERLRVDGENLAVAPIEAALREFPGVVEAAVYPVPDAAAGDQVMAALVMAGPFSPEAFAAFLAARADLGRKAVPRYVRISAELPQTPSHKVVKRLLAREAWRTTDPVWWRPYAPPSGDGLPSGDAPPAEDGPPPAGSPPSSPRLDGPPQDRPPQGGCWRRLEEDDVKAIEHDFARNGRAHLLEA
ncbi:AMP-binding protein [Nonomuraea roseoviolacea]|uniref:Fatty-acyl-CoA synthase n=1 Tax=Nonomuraea roseoviolacea subsp. carminata TaxID=160689 RepID=A0ABT1K413_9ACTN|nr:AMP-binding protein [Nonomuraea roseoviolacea]MCP2348740.1 fatty-acyl-CoA synthase [Nonomuraea roseoviolacea subsp. carminata]